MTEVIYTQADIEKIIPHRAPFLWLDEVIEIDDQHIVARKHLPLETYVFSGHYPHFPVFPGVLQCEMAMQASAILIARLQAVGTDQVPVATRMNNVQFRKMIKPGDTAVIHVEITECLQDTYFLNGKVTVNGKVTTRLEFATKATKMET